jgi:hypothetical protein
MKSGGSGGGASRLLLNQLPGVQFETLFEAASDPCSQQPRQQFSKHIPQQSAMRAHFLFPSAAQQPRQIAHGASPSR